MTQNSINNSLVSTAVPAADLTATGIIVRLVANENQAFGDVCQIATADGKAKIADASVIATSSATCMCADATITGAATGNYLLLGVARQDAWNWSSADLLIYLSLTGTTTNTLTETAPSSTDEVIAVMGVSLSDDEMFFNPSLIQVEHV